MDSNQNINEPTIDATVTLDPEHDHEKRTRWVVYLTTVTMIGEIIFGYWTNSMALLAEGWHTASHVFALGLTWVTYVVTRKYSQSDKYSFGKAKLLALSGFASAVVLLMVAIFMAVESVQRVMHPLPIRFGEAIIVAIIGVVVHGVSAIFLGHDHENHDHNIRSAYLHVLADTLTGVTAIIALVLGYFYNWYSLDSLSGILSSIVITKWAIDLMKGSGKDLIDFKRANESINAAKLEGLNIDNADILNAIIKKRRSIYPYQYEKGKPVPDEIIWQILENANRAPNHKQTEPWRFNVFSGEGLKYFGQLQASIYKQYAGSAFNEGRHQKLINYPLMSSHVIAIGMKRNEEKKLPEIEEIEAMACAVQNMFLSVTAYNLGCYWTTAGITYFEQAKEHFGLGQDDKLLGFFYIGYVAKPITAISKREPIQKKVTWVSNDNL